VSFSCICPVTIPSTSPLLYRSLLASLSDSSKHRISSTLTISPYNQYTTSLLPPWLSWNFLPGPFTFRMMLRDVSSINSTRTWVTPPREPVSHHVNFPILFTSGELSVPVLPRTLVTFTSLTGTFPASILKKGLARSRREVAVSIWRIISREKFWTFSIC
jgi:hypothetical protein